MKPKIEELAERAIAELVKRAELSGRDGARAFLEAEGPIDISTLPTDEHLARSPVGEEWYEGHPDDARQAVVEVLSRYAEVDSGILAADVVADATDIYRRVDRATFVDELRAYEGSVVRYSHNRASA